MSFAEIWSCFIDKCKGLCYVYLVTEFDGITDNVTKIQRQKSSTKVYNLIDQNTEISKKKKKS